MGSRLHFSIILALNLLMLSVAPAAESVWKARAVEPALDAYFRGQVARISGRCLADIQTLDQWTGHREEARRQLAEMLGLWPWPEKTDLKATITGKLDHEQFTVEKLYFQSRPGLYVTGNLYIPKGLKEKAPAILYVCGHSNFKKEGISYGAKSQYQHHGAWLARNGYACLVIDTLQLGEIEGIHHGTYREKMWWWHSRGYTPAGVEAWNSIRAIDYLQSRPEVDGQRIGMTGRSGGGAYTWWTAALDERVKVAIPAAGITDLQNHVVDGCIEGHCDCMYMVNTYRWDFPQVAALVAPRALLIENTDKDTIFPLDGVMRIHDKVQAIYKLYNAEDKLGVIVTEGEHHDTQELQLCAIKWFNRFLMKKETPTIDSIATRLFDPTQLRVFDRLPADQINTRVHEVFVPMAEKPRVAESKAQWEKQRDQWMAELKRQCFAGWPEQAPPLEVKQVLSAGRDGVRLRAYEFTSQAEAQLRLYLVETQDPQPAERLSLMVLDNASWDTWAAMWGALFGEKSKMVTTRPSDEALFTLLRQRLARERSTMAYFAPRGVGRTEWNGDEKKQTQILRRFALIGQTADGMRVWDVRRAMQVIASIDSTKRLPLTLDAEGRMAGIALYASLFEPPVASLTLRNLPTTHREGPELLNVLKILDMPAAVAMAAERCRVTIGGDPAAWEYPAAVVRKMGWDRDRLQVQKIP